MSIVVRPVRTEDIEGLYDLSKQFVLLNLPAEKKIIKEKIKQSIDSFSGVVEKNKARYLFVAIDTDNGKVAGSSQIVAKKGTEINPNYSFEVIKKEKFSPDLSVGFIHQILRLKIDTDGPSEIGGLVVSKDYRGRPEKVGKAISLIRFAYMGMFPEKFMPKVLSELAPPLTDEGRSEFWEALGRRFTGMPYQEADSLSQQNKDFIRNLFPEEDIYTCLLDAKARLVMGRVSKETQPALYMLQKIGFQPNDEVDPFDGGPHLEVEMSEISLIKNAKNISVKSGNELFKSKAIIAHELDGEFYAALSDANIGEECVVIPESIFRELKLSSNSNVFCTLIEN